MNIPNLSIYLYVIDLPLYPKFNKNNLIRCGLSAALITVIQLIINGIGVSWIVLLCGVTLISVPLVLLAIKRGPGGRAWRRKTGQYERPSEGGIFQIYLAPERTS